VGGAAQTKIIKKLGGGVRLALAQYRELEAFSQFASDLDDATRAQLKRGERVMELMKQKQFSPLSIARMSLSLYAVDRGHLDDIELSKVGSFEATLHAFAESQFKGLMDEINTHCNYNDEVASQLEKVIKECKATQSW
jgi:F-type H+-transporting ATPase subunit alpha